MRKTRICTLGSILLLFLSCEGPRLPFEDTDPKLVIFSEFTSDQTLQVQVSESRGIPDDTGIQRYVPDATVNLYQDGAFLETLVLEDGEYPPFYTSRFFRPQPNIRYTIRVEAPDFDPVQAQSSIPDRIPIMHLEISGVELRPQEEGRTVNYHYLVTIDFQDPAGEINYYHLNFIQRLITTKPSEEGGVPDDRLIKAGFSSLNHDVFIPGQEGGVLFSDDAFDGENLSQGFPLQFELQNTEHLGKLLVELRSVSDDYYLFQTSVTRQKGPGVPVQGEAPVYNNIENGQGIFAGYNISLDSISVIR